MRYAEKLDQLPVAGKAEEMRLIQVKKSSSPSVPLVPTNNTDLVVIETEACKISIVTKLPT